MGGVYRWRLNQFYLIPKWFGQFWTEERVAQTEVVDRRIIMRMIDADELKTQLYDSIMVNEDMDCLDFLRVESLIDAQPTAYDVDKVVQQLETARDGYSTAKLMTVTNNELVKKFIAKEKTINLAIKIVKAGGVE